MTYAAIILLLLAVWVAARIRRLQAPQLPNVRLDPAAAWYVDEAASGGLLCLVARKPGVVTEPTTCRTDLVFEVALPRDARRTGVLIVTAEQREGQRVLRAESWDVADAIAAVLLHLRDRTGARPGVRFGWPQRHPFAGWVRFLLFGCGQTALLTRHLLREAEPEAGRRPTVSVS